jgi:hypothetical protein
MEILAGVLVVVAASAAAIWCNDHLSVGEYITDELREPSYSKLSLGSR